MKLYTRYLAIFLFLFFTIDSQAQLGSIISPTQITYGIGAGWQSKYATGIGITSTAEISVLDFFADDLTRTGFRVRDVWGGHISLGGLMQPEIPLNSGRPVESRAPIWYDVGFDLGLQFIYGFNDNIWLSLKGQMAMNFNSAGYFEAPFPTSFVSNILYAGAQVGPVGLEMGKGWGDGFSKNKPPNCYSFAASWRYAEKDETYRMIGLRFAQHQFETGRQLVNGNIEFNYQKNYLLSVFYSKAI